MEDNFEKIKVECIRFCIDILTIANGLKKDHEGDTEKKLLEEFVVYEDPIINIKRILEEGDNNQILELYVEMHSLREIVEELDDEQILQIFDRKEEFESLKFLFINLDLGLKQLRDILILSKDDKVAA